MAKKMTLYFKEESLPDRAKAYADAHQTSVSELVEKFLSRIVDSSKENSGELPIAPLVEELCGFAGSFPETVDDKTALQEALKKKYAS